MPACSVDASSRWSARASTFRTSCSSLPERSAGCSLERGAVVLTGGQDGVMAAAARGAQGGARLVIGLLPGGRSGRRQRVPRRRGPDRDGAGAQRAGSCRRRADRRRRQLGNAERGRAGPPPRPTGRLPARLGLGLDRPRRAPVILLETGSLLRSGGPSIWAAVRTRRAGVSRVEIAEISSYSACEAAMPVICAWS